MKNYNLKFKVAFIVVFYNTALEERQRLGREIKSLGLNDYKLYFIDNTVNNLGFAGGVNQGIKKALKDNADLLIILNPDISFKQMSAKDIFKGAKYFDLWGLAMEQDKKIYYGGKIDKFRASGGLVEEKPKKRFTKVDFVSGSFIIIKRNVIEKIGLFDEKYFLYYEDVDYCYRTQQAGFKVGIDSLLVYKHFEASKVSEKKDYYLAINRLRFLLKNGTFKQKIYEFIRFPLTLLENISLIKTAFLKRPFIINFFSLNFSSFLNKLLHFVLFIFLVNHLLPYEYGLYTLVWAHVGLLSPLLDFGTTSYGLVYLNSERKQHFLSLFSFRLLLSVIVFSSTLLLALVFGYRKDLLLYIFLTSATIFTNMFSGSFLILSSLKGKLILPSIISVGFNAILVLGLVSSLFFFKNLIWFFMTIFILYNLYTLLNFYLLKLNLRMIKLNFDWEEWIEIIKKSFIFLLISLFAGLYFKLDVFLLNFLKGEQEVGIYSSGYKFLDALLLFAAGYNISVMPIFTTLKNSGKKIFLQKIKKDLLFLMLLGTVIVLFMFFLAPVFLPYVLRGDYLKSIQVVKIVVFAFPFILLTSVFLNVLYALDKAVLVIKIFAFQIVFNLILNIILIPHYSYIASAYITVAGEVLNVIISYLFFRKCFTKLL